MSTHPHRARSPHRAGVGAAKGPVSFEHGYNQKNLLATCRRLLKPGGIVLLTTDYNADKLDIDPDFRLFGLPYMIFSKEEIKSLISEAESSGFELLGDVNWSDDEKPIDFLERKFTFILVGLRKISAS